MFGSCRDNLGDLKTGLVLGEGIELLNKVGYVRAVLAQCWTHRRRGGRLCRRDLQFNNTSYFLCHNSTS